MLEQQKIVNQAMDGIAGLLHEYAKTTAIDEAAQKALLVFLRATLSASLANALKESELYKHINTEMRQGLQSIYKTITSVAGPGTEGASQEDTGRLFSEATEQINEVMASTFEATESIMGEVENLQDMLMTTGSRLENIKKTGDAVEVDSLIEQVTAFEDSLTRIMTSLSFQDLTGQRLKKVVAALKDIQDSIFDMYVSSGLMIKTREEMPEKELEEIAAESKRRMDELKEVKGSELKGPTRGTSQSDVDSLLADLGL
ncbi:protein phosphatase CheZ [Desulfovibrio sp. OttesenSCG-928-O18]|nr:protein phosphatase CheZ [Desulfovibrio sp. OttesenSCG-928-O18]